MKNLFYLLVLSITIIMMLYQTIKYRKELVEKHTKYKKKWTIESINSKCHIATVYSWIVIVPSCIGLGIIILLNFLKAIDYAFGTSLLHLSGWQLMLIYLCVVTFMLLSFLIFSIISVLIDRLGGKNGK